MSPAQEADAIAACVDLGLGDLPEITQWADAQFAQTAEPTDWMLALSGDNHTDLVDVLHILETIPGPRDHALSVRMAVGRLRARRPTIGPADDDLMRRLFRLTLEEIPGEIKNAIYRLDHV